MACCNEFNGADTITEPPKYYIAGLTLVYDSTPLTDEVGNAKQTTKNIKIANLDTTLLNIIKNTYPNLNSNNISITSVSSNITGIDMTSYLDVDGTITTSDANSLYFDNMSNMVYITGTTEDEKLLTNKITFMPSNQYDNTKNPMSISVNVIVSFQLVSSIPE